MSTTLILLGVVCLIAAVVGGGLKALGVEVPAIASVPRQIGLGLLGTLLVVVGIMEQPMPHTPLGNTTETTTTADSRQQGSSGQLNMITPVLDDREKNDISPDVAPLVSADEKAAARSGRSTADVVAQSASMNTKREEKPAADRLAPQPSDPITEAAKQLPLNEVMSQYKLVGSVGSVDVHGKLSVDTIKHSLDGVEIGSTYTLTDTNSENIYQAAAQARNVILAWVCQIDGLRGLTDKDNSITIYVDFPDVRHPETKNFSTDCLSHNPDNLWK